MKEYGIRDFGLSPDDKCLVAEVDGKTFYLSKITEPAWVGWS